MWWIQTSGYHLAGLIWLIVIAVVAVIAIVSLSTAGAAARNARQARRMVHDHQVNHLATDPGAAATAALPEDKAPAVVVVDSEPTASDPALGDSMKILHERYARGEITREEYLQAREDMTALTH